VCIRERPRNRPAAGLALDEFRYRVVGYLQLNNDIVSKGQSLWLEGGHRMLTEELDDREDRRHLS
jgi:hypothetical protein